MKNYNSKDYNGQSSAQKSADRQYQKAVNWLTDKKWSKLDTDAIWQNIAAKLENMDKRILTWFMACATSCTLLVAASLEYIDNHYQIRPLEIKKDSNPQTLKKTVNSIEPLPSPTPRLVMIKNRQAIIQTIPKPDQLTSDQIKHFNNNAMTKPLSVTKGPAFQQLEINGGVNYLSSGLIPEVGINFKLWQNEKENYTHYISLGISTQFVMNSSPSLENQDNRHVEAAHFVNFGYGRTYNSNQGWNAQLGYLLHSDFQSFDDTTFRASWKKKLGRHVQLGPEVRFTGDLKKVYPGISILLSS